MKKWRIELREVNENTDSRKEGGKRTHTLYTLVCASSLLFVLPELESEKLSLSASGLSSPERERERMRGTMLIRDY